MSLKLSTATASGYISFGDKTFMILCHRLLFNVTKLNVRGCRSGRENVKGFSLTPGLYHVPVFCFVW